MPVRGHNSQHDHVQSLPVISKTATGTEVTAIDRDRDEEIRAAVRELGTQYGFENAVARRGRIDWDAIFERATRTDRSLAPRIGALRDRFERDHPALVRVVFETAEPIGHAAGQHISVRFADRTRPYSIASSPNRDETEICVRRVPEGRLSARLSDDLAVGDEATLRGPNGHLCWRTSRRATWCSSRRAPASRR